MSGTDPSQQRPQPFRAFVGRHQTEIALAAIVLFGGGGIVAWHRFDLWWLESSWIQALLIGVLSLGLVALFFWGEGGLPDADADARPARRRPRAERERGGPSGWRRRSGRRPDRRRRSR